MVIVRFNQWEEFLQELEEHRPDEPVVRLTFSLRYDAQQTAHLSMVAGYLSQGSIVEFVHYLGREPAERDVTRRTEIERLLKERRKSLEEKGLTVKSGRYHVPPTLNR